MKPTLLIIPGLGDSGPAHWQSYWLQEFDNAVKLVQDDWEEPLLTDWLQRLHETIVSLNRPTVLVAHSLAVSLVAHWADNHQHPMVKAALLVCPADVDSPAHTPDVVRNFAPMPTTRLPFPSVVVASENDTYVSLERASYFAECWGSQLVNVGAKGHVNASSQLEYWQEGQAILEHLLQQIP
ncbi:MAG: alpha/beta hydrolase [Spirosomataceae bacterium]